MSPRQANEVKEYKQQLQEAKAENERLDALHHEHKVLSAYLFKSFVGASTSPASSVAHAHLPGARADPSHTSRTSLECLSVLLTRQSASLPAIEGTSAHILAASLSAEMPVVII